MTFTDDDLKRLKDDIEKYPNVTIDQDDIQALLTRMEAAEAVILDAEENLSVVNPLLVNLWREIAGLPDTKLCF